MMIGPPGTGKTMLARRLPTILPDMSFEEALETTKIYSVSGLVLNGSSIIATRPFRSPHHTISDAGLIGGGAIPKPGEVSLANNGVLFLDELPEFRKNVQSSDFIVKGRFDSEEYLAKFILIHTLSHLLIKELEFLCGYPSTSLNERLFVDENNMQGVLIYTVAGAEGSYGGLISQGTLKKFKRLLQSAIFRARDCASDPVCYSSIDGQGVGGLNMAACYSCSLLPETACEEFNCFLDRALLIDERFGFFSDIKGK